MGGSLLTWDSLIGVAFGYPGWGRVGGVLAFPRRAEAGFSLRLCWKGDCAHSGWAFAHTYLFHGLVEMASSGWFYAWRSVQCLSAVVTI